MTTATTTINQPPEAIMVCIFCKHYKTHIAFDLDLHLYECHKKDLQKLPIGRQYRNDKEKLLQFQLPCYIGILKSSMDFRIEFAIEEGKRIGKLIPTLDKEIRIKLGFEQEIKVRG